MILNYTSQQFLRTLILSYPHIYSFEWSLTDLIHIVLEQKNI